MKKTLILEKMKVANPPKLEYSLGEIAMNELVGQEISIEFTGQAECIYCQRKIKKTFNQGYCFPCSQKLARCDLCILKPELCHYHKGTCREPEWGEENCLIEHSIYLANTAGVKIGITREHQKFTRWADQGAIAAVEIARVPERLVAGQFEIAMKEHIADKTNWRKLIKGENIDVDLSNEFEKLKDFVPEKFQKHLLDSIEIHTLEYPVKKYTAKAVSFNNTKEKVLAGVLQGIRGQYLLFDEKVINVRKYQGYEVVFACV